MRGAKHFFSMVTVLALAARLPAQETAPASQPARPTPDRPTTQPAEPYTLTPDEVLRHVKAPFVDARLQIYRDTNPSQAQAIPEGPNSMIVRYADETLSFGGCIFGTTYSIGGLIEAFLHFSPKDVAGNESLLNLKVDGDFVVREKATPAQLRDALSHIVSDTTGQNITISEKPVERSVIVLQGDWTGVVPSPQKKEVDIYGQAMDGRNIKQAGGGSGTLDDFAKAVGEWIHKPVVIEAIGGPPTVGWKLYDGRNSAARKTAHNPDLVLDHIQEQTGLKWSEQPRKIPWLVVEKGE